MDALDVALQELARLGDGPGGHGLRLTQVLSSIENILKSGVVRMGETSVLGACQVPLSQWHKHAPLEMPELHVHPVIRWMGCGPVPSFDFQPLYVHVVSCVCGTYLVRLRRVSKLVVSRKVLPEYVVGAAPSIDCTEAIRYGKSLKASGLPDGLSYRSEGNLQVRTVVREGTLVRMDVVM